MKSISSLRRLIPTLFCLLYLAALSPAPLVGHTGKAKMPNTVNRDNEQTLQQMGQPASMGQVGDVPQAKQVDAGALANPSQDGQDVLAAAAANHDRVAAAGADTEAQQVLGEVERRSENQGPGKSFLWAFVVVACIVGGVYGLKRWVDSNTPEVTEPNSSKSPW
jgi:hypothetical protein